MRVLAADHRSHQVPGRRRQLRVGIQASPTARPGSDRHLRVQPVVQLQEHLPEQGGAAPDQAETAAVQDCAKGVGGAHPA
ncbi:UNVERIFIED_CONTAM: hypothetical protein GTU68_029930 [Idotea baltica]|nr:hypothetical protein [Idotea baltica]